MGVGAVKASGPAVGSFSRRFFSKKRLLSLPVFFLPYLLAACAGGGGAALGTRTDLSCVPYARAVSGIALAGDAADWWDEAAGRYARGDTPSLHAVLVFARRPGMDSGHLAVVTALRGPRVVLVTQANWLPHRIETDQPVEDVSARNDWSEVRVWYAPARAMGVSVYRTYGFILPVRLAY